MSVFWIPIIIIGGGLLSYLGVYVLRMLFMDVTLEEVYKDWRVNRAAKKVIRTKKKLKKLEAKATYRRSL